MTTRAETREPLENESTREALTRILAIESRNALARVELAASELSRFESTPAAVDRISTIHHAVDQIDGLLAKIDLLASPSTESRWSPIEVAVVWQRIRTRLDATLSARGVRFRPDSQSDLQFDTDLDLEEEPSRADSTKKTAACVEMPEAALESILYALLRVVLSTIERDQELRFEVEQLPGRISASLVVLPIADRRRGFEIDREDWFELEVRLAEWGGTLSIDRSPDPDRVRILLPRPPSIGALDA